MTSDVIGVIIKAIALVWYLVLVYITLRRGLRIRVNRLFIIYLMAMVYWQVSALLISLSNSASMALLWYRLLMLVIPAQWLVYFLFTQAFLQTRGQRKVIYLGLLTLIVLLVAMLNRPSHIILNVYRDEHIGLFVPDFGALLMILAALGYFVLGYGVFNLLQGYRRARSNLERNRLRYLLLGICTVILGSIANFVPSLKPYPIDHVANNINALLIAYAIFRYQLLDITVVVRKGLIYSIPTMIIGIGYFLLISLAMRLFQAFAGSQILLASLLVAAITAVVALPLRDRAQLWIDRLFFREKYDSSLMLQRLSRTAASVLDLNRLTNMILDEITTTMHIKMAALFLRQEGNGKFRLTAQRGLDQSAGLRLSKDHPIVDWLSSHENALTRHDMGVMPQFKALWDEEKENLERIGAELFILLKAKSELVGILAIGPKLSEVAYSQDDQLTLTTLANQMAVAVENARLYEQAQQEITERKRTEKTLRESEERYRNLFERVPVGLYRTTPEGQVLDVNPALVQMLGYPDRESLLAINVIDGYVNPQDRKQWQALIEHKGAVSEFETCWRRYDGTAIWVLDSARTIRHANGRVLCYEGAVEDITDRKRAEEQIQASLREKEVLLKEIHHRVKNNLQIISSLLDFQSEYIKDQLTLEMFREGQNRIRSMALIHEQLYQSKDLARIDFAEYVRDLTDYLFQSYGASGDAITLEIHIADILLGIDTAIPCGLIINELVSNALKYAFPLSLSSPPCAGGKEGRCEILVALHSDNDQLTLIVSDNGVGFPRDLDFLNAETLGLRLVNMLSRQLKGTIELDRNDGTTLKITFARPKP